MFQSIPLIAMQFVGIVGALTIAAIIVTANMYDILLAASNKRPAAKTKRTRKPVVSIIICVDSANQNLEQTLDSIRRNGYRKLECIIADNASGSASRSQVNKYAKRYESLAIFCLIKKKRISRRRLFSEALTRYGSGETVLWLQAGDSLERGEIARLVMRLTRTSADIVRPRIILGPQHLLGSTLKTYQLILNNTINKSLSIMHVLPASFERGIAAAKSFKSETRQLRTEFAYDSTVMDGTDWTLSRFYADNFHTMGAYYMRLLRRLTSVFTRRKDADSLLLLPIAVLQSMAGLLLPLILCYFVYLALYLLQPVFLAVSLGSVSVILLYCIWGEFSMPIVSKIRLSFGVPVTFFAYFVLSFVPIVALFGGQADS